LDACLPTFILNGNQPHFGIANFAKKNNSTINKINGQICSNTFCSIDTSVNSTSTLVFQSRLIHKSFSEVSLGLNEL
jgi:hypothetical protein